MLVTTETAGWTQQRRVSQLTRAARFASVLSHTDTARASLSRNKIREAAVSVRPTVILRRVFGQWSPANRHRRKKILNWKQPQIENNVRVKTSNWKQRQTENNLRVKTTANRKQHQWSISEEARFLSFYYLCLFAFWGRAGLSGQNTPVTAIIMNSFWLECGIDRTPPGQL